MSPILVRPVREQLEHDRVIRLLQAKYKRNFDVGINPGIEQHAPLGAGAAVLYPDLVLHSSQRGRKLMGVVEVETVESVNHLEAISEWRALARLRGAFYLYVPTSMVDPARRMCLDLGVSVAELWAYHQLGDQMRFTLIKRSASAARQAAAQAAAKKTALKGTRKGARKADLKVAPKGSGRASKKVAAKKVAVKKQVAAKTKSGLKKKSSAAKKSPAKTARTSANKRTRKAAGGSRSRRRG